MTRIISIVGGLQPSTPTIGTATDGGTGTSANVAFTASSYIGKGTITYTATSSPGGLTGTSATSPISVTGLTTGTAYTFTVTGTTNYGVTSLTSGSSNSVTPANPDSGAMFAIASTTVGTSSVSSITFSSIPSTYKHLQVRAFQKASSAGDLNFIFNGDSGANYTRHYLYGNQSSVGVGGTGSQSLGYVGYNPSSVYYQSAIIDILDYASTSKTKTVKSLLGTDTNGGGYILLTSSAWYGSPAAISSITFTSGGGNFQQYSSFALYGIKGA